MSEDARDTAAIQAACLRYFTDQISEAVIGLFQFSAALDDGLTPPLRSGLQHSSAELLSKVNTARTLTELADGARPAQAGVVELRTRLEKLAQNWASGLRRLGSSLAVHCTPADLTLVGDEKSVQGMLWTLMEFAAGHSDQDKLTLAAKLESDEVLIRFSGLWAGRRSPPANRLLPADGADEDEVFPTTGDLRLVLIGRLCRLLGGRATSELIAGEGLVVEMRLPLVASAQPTPR